MSVFKSRLVSLLQVGVLFFISDSVHAGAYIFADEFNGVNYIAHPPNYSGTEDVVTLRVCIDPASHDAQDMEYSVQNVIATYNELTPTTDNVKLTTNNNVPSGTFDFESTALHEIGHCLGLGHINLASESGVSGSAQNYTRTTNGTNDTYDLNAAADSTIGSSDDIRGDDVNLFWFRLSNNDPFTIDTVIDSTTYSRELIDLPTGHVFAANADRAVSTLLGYPITEAVMQQGTIGDEAQRTLGHDDVAALRYAESGINELESGGNGPFNNANDNYTIVLEYGGISTSNCDINMSITDTTSLAFCSVSGDVIGTNHASVTNPSIEFGNSYNWFFNAPNTAPVLNSIGDQSLLDGGNLVVNISASDVDTNTLSFSVSDLPSFASFVDNNDGTATLTISPPIGENSVSTMTITVSDDGSPLLSDNETFDIEVALDSDGDGLSDDDEINIHGTSPSDPDSDDDGLNDYEEVILYGTLPNDEDSDDDFINDFDEVNNGSDPLDDTSWPAFADGDIAPLGSPDGMINAADYLVAQRIVIGDITATSLELAHGDLYPTGSPDGVINTPDLILLLQLIQ